MPEFNDLPSEVIEGIVSHCTSSAVLQLRLTSKRIHGIVDGSKRFKDVFQDFWIWIHPNRPDRGTTLKRFLEEAPDFPFQNFRIQMGETIPPHFFEDPERLQQFMDRFSASIRRLHVSQMYCGTVVGEMDFYESLENLQVLKINSLEPSEEGDSQEFQVCPRRLPRSGPVGHSMKSLDVRSERGSGDYLIEWIRLCPSLEVMSVPQPSSDAFGRAQFELDRHSVYPYVLRLGSEGNLEQLKVLDMNGVRMQLGLCNEGDICFFYDLLTRRNDFRLKNVRGAMLEEVRSVCVFPKWPWGTLELFKRKVLSTCGVHEMLSDDEGFPLLEEVTWDGSVPRDGWNVALDEMRLSGLKKINVRTGLVWIRPAHLRFLDRLFLPETPRGTVVDLEFRYDWLADVRMNPAYLDGGFPNLTRVVLRLNGFDREERIQVIEVMSRKTFLEDLSLETREGTPEEAFFGNEEDSPVLLRLTSLRKLSMRSTREGLECEEMGDRSLRLFARMSLTHLIINGRGWGTVTNEGIGALLEGPFGESVVSLELDGLNGGDEARSGALVELKGLAQRNRIKWSHNCFKELQVCPLGRKCGWSGSD